MPFSLSSRKMAVIDGSIWNDYLYGTSEGDSILASDGDDTVSIKETYSHK